MTLNNSWINVSCDNCGTSNFHHLYEFNYRKFGISQPFYVVECKNCGLILNNPRLTSQGITSLYEKNYYVFENTRDMENWIKATRDFYTKVKPMAKKDKINLLEIGCAKGFLLKIAQTAGWQVQGVEISAYASEYAKNENGLKVFTGKINDYHDNDNFFDMVIAFDVIEHVESPTEFLHHCFLKLCDGGILILETPNYDSIYRKCRRKGWVGFNPYHLYYFTPKSIVNIAKKEGLFLKKIETDDNAIFARNNLWRWRISPKIIMLDFLEKLGFSKCHDKLDGILMNRPNSQVANTTPLIQEAVQTPVEQQIIKRTSFLEHYIGSKMLGDQLVIYLEKRKS